MKWDDPRVRVVKLAGRLVPRRRAAGRRRSRRGGGSRSCRSPRTSTTRTRSPSGTPSGACRRGYVPAEVAPELRGDEQALSLWEFRDEDGQRIGLRVLLAPADAWIQEPRDPRSAEGTQVLPRATSRSRRSSPAARSRFQVAERRLALGRRRRAVERPRSAPVTRSTARSRCAARGPGRRSSCASTRSSPRDWGGRGRTARPFTLVARRRLVATSASARVALGAVPRRDRDAAAGARRALDDPAAALGREHRLQGARRRHDALPPDPGRRRAAVAGDGHGAQGDGEVSGTAIECPLERAHAHARRRAIATSARRSRAPRTPGSRSASTRISTPPPSRRLRRCST